MGKVGKVGKAYNCNSSQQLQQFYAKIVHKCIKKTVNSSKAVNSPDVRNSFKVYNSCQGLPPVWAWVRS